MLKLPVVQRVEKIVADMNALRKFSPECWPGADSFSGWEPAPGRLPKRTVYAPGSFPVVCSCGRRHNASAWCVLFFVGIQSNADEATGRRYSADLELRNCICGSTISVKVEEV